MSAQESIITGLENIRISEGATIVTVEKGESKINYSSISAPINQKNTKILTTIKDNCKRVFKVLKFRVLFMFSIFDF